MTSDVTVYAALLAGLLSFASPCVFPLVPPYLGYLAGVSLDQLAGETSERVARRAVFVSALAFVLGFSTVFVALGAAANFVLGAILRQYQYLFAIIGGVLIIVIGLHFLGVFRIGVFYREARLRVRGHPGVIGSYLVGLAFAIGWTPCIGPVLGVILGVASARDPVLDGAGLLAFYSLGLGLPFLAASLFAGPFMRFMRRFRGQVGKVEKATGALLVVAGILFVTGEMTTLSFWLLSLFPSLAQLG